MLGHEASGVIVELASQTRHRIGDRVAIEPGVPCGRCRVCRTGRYNLCPEMRFMATPPVHGAFARYVAVNEDFGYPIPDSMTAEEAALVEPLSVGIWACKRAGVQPGDRVLITGAGPVGLLAAQAARAFGASTVTLRDIEETRLGFARDRGFLTDDDVNGGPATPSGPCDVLMECSGRRERWAPACAPWIALAGRAWSECPRPTTSSFHWSSYSTTN